MNVRSGKSFLIAHYDWIVLVCSLIVLIVGGNFCIQSLDNDTEQAVAAERESLQHMKPSDVKINSFDMTAMENATRLVRSPTTSANIAKDKSVEKDGNFLASECRVYCTIKTDKDGKKIGCGKAIPEDLEKCPKCPFCGKTRVEEKKADFDTDGDGIPDTWEKKYGLNMNDASDANSDKDGDDFTNLEEYVAKTDPTDKKDHPDYLDSLKINLPIEQTYMPFILIAANQIPSGWRCSFFNAREKDDYGRTGRTITATIGEKIGATEYVLKAFEKKEIKQDIQGGQGMTKMVDVSEALVEREGDGKKVRLTLANNKKAKPAPVDIQAKLTYERRGTQEFTVVPGSELVLSGYKYKVNEIKASEKAVKITIENLLSGKKRVLTQPIQEPLER